ncbi:MAG: type I DNA topoisomerase [Prevotella sp.]|nr:type I DNA topoisomerase [Prevotella sp.]
MQQNLVIVESPAKAKTIERFLGKDYKVMSSYGHIRDLKKKEISIDLDNLQPHYEIPDEKKRLVAELKKQSEKAEKVWLASDEDREGEAISWHLCEVLGLDEDKTNRIVFHEITKQAILDAIANPRHIDMNLVNAQQARRLLDRLVGFKLSPVLWKKVKPALSAGRVQSVAVRLIVEREREIQNFKTEPYYRVVAVFNTEGNAQQIRAELNTRFSTHEEALAFLEKCKDAKFKVNSVTKKPVKRAPAPPFTTSTLQQEAARKLGFTVSQTMMLAQHLYENGFITYMRTDSVNLSSLCIGTSKEEVTKLYGEQYSRPRNYHTNAKGAQEAHEAIRPSYISTQEIDSNKQERRLYELIWKRTIASQMADAMLEKTTIEIGMEGCDDLFVATGEVITFDGFLKIYHESVDDDDAGKTETGHLLPPMNIGDTLQRDEIVVTERYLQGPQRYTEATLVHKMEELGIGRPSTYAPTISTIQQREYVVKGDKKGTERNYTIDTLKGNRLTSKTKKEMVGNDKGKLMPTDIGIVVNDFLTEHFKDIVDYNFTAKIEEQFDLIAEGKSKWESTLQHFYKDFEPEVKKASSERSEHKVGEREIGVDPKTGRKVFVKIGRFGPLVQIGSADDAEKPQFAQIPADKSISTITLDEALELFKLPRTVGQLEGTDVVIGAGKFGPYVMHNKKYVSLPKSLNPMTVTLEEATQLIMEKRTQEQQRHIKAFEEDKDLELLNGKYGPYIAYKGKNYRIPKAMHGKVADLTLDECMKIIEQTPEKPRRRQ